MSKIISIGTALPIYCHQQMDIMHFMQNVYAMNDVDRRKMAFLYKHCGIKQRYSVVPDYSRSINEWKFYPHSENLEPFPSLEHRMAVYNKYAPALSVDAIRNCLNNFDTEKVTHLITVSCTGMSAPGLDLQVMELMDFDKNIFRTSVNFMGCYAAIHALKMADAFCKSDAQANVLIVCTELCTLHFQRDNTMDNIASSLLFGDGAAAVLVSGDNNSNGLHLDGFYSEVIPKGKRDMAWELSSTGFLMTLSGYVPDLIEEDFNEVVERSLQKNDRSKKGITHWCIHPGGKRILEAIQKSVGIEKDQLQPSYKVLEEHGNMSSATILFTLKEIMHQKGRDKKILSAAFGPGLTVETFTASN
ncbi:MAG TPA: type III polyketide synthase [Chitinophagaceae bacterium]|nr:type III polyketide synthase [Chitinophagaceae bacterium]